MQLQYKFGNRPLIDECVLRAILHAEGLNSAAIQNVRDGILREILTGNIMQDERFHGDVFCNANGWNGVFIFSAMQTVNAQSFDAGKILNINEREMIMLESTHMYFLNGQTM